MDPLAAECLGDASGQLGELAGRAADRGRLAEQVAQQLLVDVGAPRQPVDAHLGGEQRAGRLGGHQEPEPGRIGGCVDPGLLVAVHVEESVEARHGRRRVEQGALRVAGWDRRLGRRIVRDRPAGQPGQRRRQAARLPPPSLVPEQQRLGQLQIVAAVHPDPGPDQPRIALGGGRPQPARTVGRPHRGGKVVGVCVGGGVQPAQPGPTGSVGNGRNQHSPILAGGSDSSTSARPRSGRPGSAAGRSRTR